MAYCQLRVILKFSLLFFNCPHQLCDDYYVKYGKNCVLSVNGVFCGSYVRVKQLWVC